jgi:hypothetical protein
MAQTTQTLLMIRPVSFTYNQETASTNAFQQGDKQHTNAQQYALDEFNLMVKKLRDNGVQVMVIEDTPQPHTPDSIFPNNWFSTHDDGRVVLYPMFAPNRRQERRPDIFDTLTEYFVLEEFEDLTPFEKNELFLEGTGSMVLDRDSRICYACYSPRTHAEPLKAYCDKIGYELIGFDAIGQNGQPIYHTNVMMCVGEKFLLYCPDSMPDAFQRAQIEQSTSKKIIHISLEQMNQFAGNMLEVKNTQGEQLLLMSTTAYESLHPQQITELEKYCRILHFAISSIENHGGGSVRCMCAEVFLTPKNR